MDIKIGEIDGVAVVLLPGKDLDAASTAEFKSTIAPVLKAHSRVVFDLSQIRFIDSSGLGAFLSCLRQLSTKGGELKLCGMSKQVYQTFELVRMHRIFDIYNTMSEAVQAFQP
ncbi:MAG: STAS domain-containing protein [Beijerinckiaceae bacterium]|nr:STAS domain-containing protein [Beijerinckiaceae bacterium]